jgi:serine/threonine protein kinase
MAVKILCKEAILWRQLQHPHILNFLGVDAETFASRNSLCMVSPWMNRGTLKEFINSSSYEIESDRDRLVRKTLLIGVRFLMILHIAL